jgi:hypothetical protein
VGTERETVKWQAIYGTAEAVPFVNSFFPIWLKPAPTLKRAVQIGQTQIGVT